MWKTIIVAVFSIIVFGSCVDDNKKQEFLKPIGDKTVVPYLIQEKVKTDTAYYQIEKNDDAVFVFYKQKPIYVIEQDDIASLPAGAFVIILLILFLAFIAS